MEQRSVLLKKALFIISLDTELAWGSFDRGGLERYAAYYAQVRTICNDLIALFHKYRIKATWAFVGHLFLNSCSQDGPDNHNHVLQPSYSWYPGGWLSHDPYSNVDEAPFFYAPDIIEAVRASGTGHEIASHTFTHAILGDPECTAEVAWSQLAECKRVAEALGIDVTSLVFPRNSVGHLDVLSRLNFLSFRGTEARWHYRARLPKKLAGLMHFADRLTAWIPPVYDRVNCCKHPDAAHWTVDLPASMFYPPRDGLWKLVPLSRRVTQAVRGIKAAVRDNALFHIWFHPFNLATCPSLLDGLEEILSEARACCDGGKLESVTMREAALHVNRLVPHSR